MQQEQMVRNGGDVLGLVSWVGWFAGVLPAIGLFVTAVWTVMRITEMVTGEPFHKTRAAAAIRCLVRRVLPGRSRADKV
jgi:hypothetical protein